MTSIAAPNKVIALAALVPDIVRSCVIAQPAPPPDPGEEPPAPVPADDIYTPVAPGVTYPALPTVTIVDTTPTQIIGCAVDVATNPQGRLDALFPSAVAGDGVIDRATNDIWVYNGSSWDNVGPTPGPTPVVTNVVPPWNEILPYDATVRTKLTVTLFAYALELLTTEAIKVRTKVAVRSAPAYVGVPSTSFTFTVYTPVVSGGAAVLPASIAATVTAPTPVVSSGGSALVPLTAFGFNAEAVPYVGFQATVVQSAFGNTALTTYLPTVITGAAVEPPVVDIATASPLPVIISKPAPVVQTYSSQQTATNISFQFTNISVNQDDIIMMVVEVSGDGPVSAPTTSAGLAGPMQAISGSPVIDVATSAGSTLQAWWLRAPSTLTSQTITIPAPVGGDHQLARYMILRGCANTGNPWDVTGTATKTVASFSATAPAVTTTVGNTLVISVVSRPNDNSNTLEFGSATNSVLSPFVKYAESGSSNGNGGGFTISAGTKRLPGSTGVTSYSTVASTTNASITIAFKP